MKRRKFGKLLFGFLGVAKIAENLATENDLNEVADVWSYHKQKIIINGIEYDCFQSYSSDTKVHYFRLKKEYILIR